MGKTAEELYNEREKRIEDVSALKVPDRVPIAPFDTGWCYKYTGTTFEEAHYDYAKRYEARKKTVTDMQWDAFTPSLDYSGAVYDLLDFKQLKWAGARRQSSRVGATSLFQFVEPGGAYEEMPVEDYDWFLDDPSDYVLRSHWPRISGTLEPLKNLMPMHNVLAYYVGMFELLPAIGMPEVAKAFEAIIAAGRESYQWLGATIAFLKEMKELGYPCLGLGWSIAPYDYFADFLRGTRGSMLDMYRCPDKLKQAVNKVTPWMIEWGISSSKAVCGATGIQNPRIFIPIHKGAGGFMSNAQYEEFFWPTLRALIMGLIDAGLTPYVYTEGEYSDRLPIIKDVPRGKVIYHIEKDIYKAKAILGDTACLVGGPVSSLLNMGSPDEVRDSCKKLIDVVGEGGGFMMGVELPLLTAKVENIKAMTDFVMEYGVYK